MKHVRRKRGARRGPPPRAGHLRQVEGQAGGRLARDPVGSMLNLPRHRAPAATTAAKPASQTPRPWRLKDRPGRPPVGTRRLWGHKHQELLATNQDSRPLNSLQIRVSDP